MVSNNHNSKNRIQRIAVLSDEALQVDELMDLGEGIRFEDRPSLDKSESESIVEWIKRTNREPLLYALWLTLLAGDTVELARDLAVLTIRSKERPARSAAAIFLELKCPSVFQAMLEDLVADPDSNIAFRASIQAYSNDPMKLVSRIIALFPHLSFDNFDEAVELTRVYGSPENVPALISAFGKRASFGEIRELIDELKNRSMGSAKG